MLKGKEGKEGGGGRGVVVMVELTSVIDPSGGTWEILENAM